jgi:hypothetical protein
VIDPIFGDQRDAVCRRLAASFTVPPQAMTVLITHADRQEMPDTARAWSDDDTLQSFENRWAAWQSEGLARDVRTRRRMLIVGIVGGLAALSWVAGTMIRG